MGLVTLSALLYQIAATRLLSVVLWYHFAFLSISVAMLGLGASGVWFSLRPYDRASLRRALWTAGLSIPLSVCVIVKARPLILACGLGVPGWIGTLIVAMLVPMYALGSAVCLLLLFAHERRVGTMYSADLLGATLGAALVIPCMAWISTPVLLALTGLLPLLALALVDGTVRAVWLCCAGAIVAAALWGVPFQVGYAKLYVEEDEAVPLHEIWTPTARITVFSRPIFSPDPNVPWGWGYGSRFVPKPTEERWIDQDGSAGTPVERAGVGHEPLEHLFFDVTSFGYQLTSPRRVCIIGAGGGRDVLTALAAGATAVDAVEFNGAIVGLLTGPLAEFSGDVYRRPGVRAVIAEGRSFLTHTRRRYDLLQISLVDSWAATAAGAYSLSENYLYTVEAMRLYLRRLTDRGVISISRWSDSVQPFEGARLIRLAERALELEGVSSPRDHLMFVSNGQVGTLIVGKRPLSAALHDRAARIAAERGFVQQWPPPPGPVEPSLVSMVMTNDADVLTQAGVDLEPPVDDRPFFFQAARVFRLGGEDLSAAAPSDVNLQSVSILRTTIAILGILVVCLFFLPFLVFRKVQRGRGFWSGTAYFALIGVGFMLLELPFIQQSILYLGHPSYAAAVVIASLLLGASVGAAWVSRVAEGTARHVFLLVPLATAAVAFGASPLFRATLHYPWPARVALTFAMFGSAGVFLGAGIPVGLGRYGDRQKAWFWAINGAAGVLASALSIALAMTWGFVVTSAIGIACYVLAGPLVVRRGAASE